MRHRAAGLPAAAGVGVEELSEAPLASGRENDTDAEVFPSVLVVAGFEENNPNVGVD